MPMLSVTSQLQDRHFTVDSAKKNYQAAIKDNLFGILKMPSTFIRDIYHVLKELKYTNASLYNFH